MIDEAGNLLDPDECRRMNPYSPWIRYLHEAEEYNMAFYFTEGEHPVYISQKDIRQIQMAKSSICSGCLALLEEAGLTLESIDYLVLAGAFGNYIDIDNALSIGLLPPVSREKIISIGNGAGQGYSPFCWINLIVSGLKILQITVYMYLWQKTKSLWKVISKI